MNRAKVSKLNAATKVHVTAFVNAATKARIDAMARVSGLSRGQLVDIAIEAVEPCQTCEATGHESPDPHRGPEHTDPRCSACAGYRVLPKNP